MQIIQVCVRCKTAKSLDQFGKNSRATNGKMYHCKECENERSRIRDAQLDRKIYHRNNARKNSHRWVKNRKPTQQFINDPGYIYLMHMNGLYKIGKGRDVQRRYEAIRAFMPYPVELIHSFAVDHMSQEELILHKKYQRWRTNGEWFQLSEVEVNEIKSL